MIAQDSLRETARLRRYVRELTSQERKQLASRITRMRAREGVEEFWPKALRNGLTALVVSAVIAPLAWWIWNWIVAVVLAVLPPGIYLLSLPEEKRRHKMFREGAKGSIARATVCLESGSIEVTRCQPLAYVEFEEYEDEGEHYVFDVGEGTLLFLGGQDWYPTKQFPSTDFEISESHEELHENLGGKMEPVRTVPAAEAQEVLRGHGTMFTFEGRLETVEQDLAVYYEKQPEFRGSFKR